MKTYKIHAAIQTEYGVGSSVQEDGSASYNLGGVHHTLTPEDVYSLLLTHEATTWRETGKLSKSEFLIRVKDAGILTKADAKAAAKGDWPESMQTALTSMPAKDAEDAQITWSAVTTVHRKSPIISFVQVAAGLTDEQVDGLFGWQSGLQLDKLRDWQFGRYRKATQRLAQYVLSVGREAIYEDQETGEFNDKGVAITAPVLIQSAIDPLEATVAVMVYDEASETSSEQDVPNPLIVTDDEERAAAQAVVDATPNEVQSW